MNSEFICTTKGFQQNNQELPNALNLGESGRPMAFFWSSTFPQKYNGSHICNLHSLVATLE